jgi:hypothetical protein
MDINTTRNLPTDSSSNKPREFRDNRDNKEGREGREHREGREQGSNSTVKKEVDHAIKETVKKNGMAQREVWQMLKDTHGNNPALLEKIFDEYKERYDKIFKKAMKFKKLIFNKYANHDITFSEMMKKAKKYGEKLNFTHNEFDLFANLAIYDRSDKYKFSAFFEAPNTKIATTLGYDIEELRQSKLNIPANEYSTLEKIIRLDSEFAPTHSKLVVQALTYRDCAPELLKARYETLKHDSFQFVHPVWIAMFGPKIQLFDERILFARLSSIIKSKHEKKPILTKPEMDLYLSIVNDPNDGVCSPESVMNDFLLRCEFSTLLSNTVFNLRQGRVYYSDNEGDKLIGSLSKCRHSIYDSPDMFHVHDEGNIIRRTMNVYSLRPTILSISQLATPVNQFNAITPQYVPFAANPSKATTVPLITHRLKNVMPGQNTNIFDSSLEDTISSRPQWFVENKTLVPKQVSVIHSEGVIIFHVPRRYQNLNIARFVKPHVFTNLPLTYGGWEALNDSPVNYNDEPRFFNEEFKLRSVVMVEKMPSTGLIIGCTTALITNDSHPSVFLYDPQNASYMHEKRNYNSTMPFNEIPNGTHVDMTSTISADETESFRSRASKRGTIFIYQKVSGDNFEDDSIYNRIRSY